MDKSKQPSPILQSLRQRGLDQWRHWLNRWSAPFGQIFKAIGQWVAIMLLIFSLMVAVAMIGAGFQAATGDQAAQLFQGVTNPFLGLMVGMIGTALIQSSSTVTSIIVALVAGGLPVAIAVPMVMGANIGTTITNTLVSLGHVTNPSEFRKAFAAATIHDVFNLLGVVIFLPLEILFHPLERTGDWLAHLVIGNGAVSLERFNLLPLATQPIVKEVQHLLQPLSHPFDHIMLIGLGMGLIIATITAMGALLKSLMVGRAKDILNQSIGRGPITGITAGMVITMVVQSSSTTTSLMVPLAGTGVLELAQVYPFTLGANIGTCVTALLAATAISGASALPALEIALVHLVYNVLGVLVIYGLPGLRQIPLRGAQSLANLAAERKALAFLYIVTVFFLIPGLCLGLFQTIL